MNLESLIELDKELLLTINGAGNLFLDGFAWIVTDTKTWIPAGAMLLYVIFKNNKPLPGILTVVMLAVAITLADQFASGLCKPYFHRFRPTHDPELMNLVHTVGGYRGGLYGFISSHAANTFAVATFVSLTVRNWRLVSGIFLWALISSYSRMYLGVHYPGDILCGAIAGALIGAIVYMPYSFIYYRIADRSQYISDQYTSSGYLVNDLRNLNTVLLLTYFFAMSGGMIVGRYMHF